MLDRLTDFGSLARLEGIPHEFVQGDVADAVTATGAADGCQAIVNFAAETNLDASGLASGGFIVTDVYGTHVLLEFARVAGIRYVQVSTSEADRPATAQAASKGGADLQVQAYVEENGLSASVIARRPRVRAVSASGGRARRGDRARARRRGLTAGDALRHVGARGRSQRRGRGSSSAKERRARSTGSGRTTTPSVRSAGSRRGRSKTGSPRPWSGTARGATGGSRSGPGRRRPRPKSSTRAATRNSCFPNEVRLRSCRRGPWKARCADSPSRSPF